MNIISKRFQTLASAIILLIIAMVLNKFNIIRVILCLTSIGLLTYSAQLERSNKKVFIPLFIFIFTFLAIALDYICVITFKHTPIFTYSVVSTKYGKVYNSIGYRVWSCNYKTIIVDSLYKLGYYCEKENIMSESINNVLSNIASDFDKYKDSYVKVIGRVTNVVDDQTFYMQSYKEVDSIINFDSTNNLYVVFNIKSKEIADLKPETIVTVVGKIDRKDNNNIYMIDSKISIGSISSEEITLGAESNIYCDYNKELWFQTSNNIFYKSCINDVNLTISGSVYNLQNAIKNNLITLDEIKNEALGYQEQSNDKSIIYNYKDFKIMVCDPEKSLDVIIGRNEMEFSDGYCNVNMN